jgi:hypothetical protein
MIDEPDVDVLRAAFVAANGPESPLAAEDLEAIQRALDGELGASEQTALLDRLALEPELATAWRLARELRTELVRAPASFPRRPWVSRHRALLTAAALVVATVGAIWLRAPSPPVERAPAWPAIESQLAESALLSRDRFELAWQSPFAGARFDVDVLDAELRVLYRARGLSEPRVVVPVGSFAGLAPGSDVLWRVEARLPGGAASTSRTFVQRIE